MTAFYEILTRNKYRINVETACHPEIDQIAVRIKSELLQKTRIGIRFEFP